MTNAADVKTPTLDAMYQQAFASQTGTQTPPGVLSLLYHLVHDESVRTTLRQQGYQTLFTTFGLTVADQKVLLAAGNAGAPDNAQCQAIVNLIPEQQRGSSFNEQSLISELMNCYYIAW
ncbi:hypothetical protein [Archangium sp.]|uniref:hypothetical protein n=1 Tax=Archangium sp. TaxID=1872627 RepID=UPI003899B2E0